MGEWVPATDSKLKRALKYLSIAYVLLLAACLVALILIGVFGGTAETELGCYFWSLVLLEARCKGFMGAEALALIVNLPLLLVFAPLFGVSGLIKGQFVLDPLFLLVGLAMWAPIIYLLWHVRRGKFVLAAIALALIAWALVLTA